MTDSQYRFEKIFVVEPAHEVSILSKYSSQIIFVTDGGDKIEDISNRIESLIKDFNPDTDAIIPMGRAPSNFLAGLSLVRYLIFQFITQKKVNTPVCITFGVYRNEEYTFITTELK